jgi:hypothetical protein
MPSENIKESMKTATSKEEIDETKPPSKGEMSEEKPIDQWTNNQFSRELFFSIVEKDHPKEKEISKKYLESDFANNEEAKIKWEAYRLYLKITFRKENLLDQLIHLMNSNPTHADVISYVASSYLIFKEYELAANYFEKSASLTKDINTKFERLCNSCLFYAKAGISNKSNKFAKSSKFLSPPQADGVLRNFAPTGTDFAKAQNPRSKPRGIL